LEKPCLSDKSHASLAPALPSGFFDVSKVRFIVVFLVCVSPAVLLWDGLIVQGLIAAVVAVGLAITAQTLRPGEAEFLVSIVRPAAAVAAIPALWILFQALPFGLLSNPIWASAQLALGHSMATAISVDPGASVIGLGQYLSLGATAFLSAAVAVDRGRAEWVLFVLTGASAVLAVILIAHGLFFPAFSGFTQAQAADCVTMGGVIAGAACMRSIERYESRHTNSYGSEAVLLWTLGACGGVLVLCALAVLLDETPEVFFAMGSGVAIIVWIMVVRRFRLGVWGVAPFVVVVFGVALLVFTAHPVERGHSVLLTFAPSSSPGGVSERILKDAPVVGTGAGTFAALVPIYREIDDPPASSVASTAAATLAIELGRPMVWLFVLTTVALVLIFLRAALERRRDSFYPAMGGGCLVALLLLTFINAGLLGNAASLIASVVFGLAIAQSKSRTA
jgi:hypothetical protein